MLSIEVCYSVYGMVLVQSCGYLSDGLEHGDCQPFYGAELSGLTGVIMVQICRRKNRGLPSHWTWMMLSNLQRTADKFFGLQCAFIVLIEKL
jgi:hypothetical protein